MPLKTKSVYEKIGKVVNEENEKKKLRILRAI
jgi:hypothetical protein